MDVEYDSELSDTDYEEIDDSDMIRPYMYEPIRRKRDKGCLMTLIFRGCGGGGGVCGKVV